MEESSCPISIRAEIDPFINLAVQQNGVPVVKSLRIQNKSDVPQGNLEITVSVDPAVSRTWRKRISDISPQSCVDLCPIQLQLSPGFFTELTERLHGELSVEVRRGSDVLCHWSTPVELLARNEWGGLSSVPEILAAFVLPNHPAISQVLRTASDILLKWTRNPSLSGYQSKSRTRSYRIAAAMFGALQGLKLTYMNPPASFGSEGQRVRLPDEVFKGRMATCLDLSLLAAACLEQAGLHPLVMLKQGHAFAGVWLNEDCSPDPVVYDASYLREKVERGDLAVFDPTFVAYRPFPGFDKAVAEGNVFLLEEGEFVCAIDVKRARKGRIRPLPVRVIRDEIATYAPAKSPRAVKPPSIPVSLLRSEVGTVFSNPRNPYRRITQWGRKLIDLMRGRFINVEEATNERSRFYTRLPSPIALAFRGNEPHD